MKSSQPITPTRKHEPSDQTQTDLALLCLLNPLYCVEASEATQFYSQFIGPPASTAAFATNVGGGFKLRYASIRWREAGGSCGAQAGTTEFQDSCAPRTAPPNPSFEARPNGKPPGPARWYAVHFHRAGPGVLPLVPPQLER